MEAQGSIGPDSLRLERDLLAECLSLYDKQLSENAEQVSRPHQPNSDSFAEAVRSRISVLNGESPEDAANAPKTPVPRRGVSRALQIGCIVCLFAIAAVYVNDRFYSSSKAMENLTGHWRMFQYTKIGEDQSNYYRSYDGHRLTVNSPSNEPGRWFTYHREVSLEPAQGFYVLRLVNVPGVRPDRDSSMFVHIDGDRVNEIRGLHPLDGVRIPVIATFRRSAEGPDEATAAE